MAVLMGWATLAAEPPLPDNPPARAATAAPSPADSALLAMREAFRRNNTTELVALLPQVRGHRLEPLALYWSTRARLDTASPADIRQALQRMAGTYWEDRLRNDWLLQLGQQRDWANFSSELAQYRMNDDRQVQCYTLMRDVLSARTSGADAARQLVPLWHTQRDAEEACAATAKFLLDTGHLRPLAVWQRARLGMDANRPRVVAQAVGMLNPDWVRPVETVAGSPEKYLNEKLTALRPRTQEIVTLAIIRLASDDPALAAEHLQNKRWQLQLSAEERSWLWGVIGRRSAQKLQTEALGYFARGEDRWMHSEHLAWKTRAALRAGAWATVRETINVMETPQRNEAAWVYWQARAVQALQRPDASSAETQARTLYESIAAPTGFYELLALEALGRPIAVPPAPAPLTAAEQAAAEQNPGLQRALAALALGLRTEGVREWNYTVGLHTPGGLSERELLAAAALACRFEIWDRCIHTSQRTLTTLDHSQRYPMPHQRSVLAQTQAIGLDPAYVYGLIRQESRFTQDARSPVGASGLMQVMPATARWTARKIGLTDFQPQHISQLDTNIRIGTAYLKFALDAFDNALPLAAAAYNAGPSRARAWRNGPSLPADIWTENIPFDETRDYVKRVLANTTHYAALITGQPQSLRQRLGTIAPAGNSPSRYDDLP
jgi:soluble lytic murein transglycosylase